MLKDQDTTKAPARQLAERIFELSPIHFSVIYQILWIWWIHWISNPFRENPNGPNWRVLCKHLHTQHTFSYRTTTTALIRKIKQEIRQCRKKGNYLWQGWLKVKRLRYDDSKGDGSFETPRCKITPHSTYDCHWYFEYRFFLFSSVWKTLILFA